MRQPQINVETPYQSMKREGGKLPILSNWAPDCSVWVYWLPKIVRETHLWPFGPQGLDTCWTFGTQQTLPETLVKGRNHWGTLALKAENRPPCDQPFSLTTPWTGNPGKKRGEECFSKPPCDQPFSLTTPWTGNPGKRRGEECFSKSDLSFTKTTDSIPKILGFKGRVS